MVFHSNEELHRAYWACCRILHEISESSYETCEKRIYSLVLHGFIIGGWGDIPRNVRRYSNCCYRTEHTILDFVNDANHYLKWVMKCRTRKEINEVFNFKKLINKDP